MTQEDKDILLKDLCGRLPYHTMCYSALKEENFELSDVTDCNTDYPTFENGWFDLDEVKPYLFPLSSMTEEQRSILEDWEMNEPMLDISGERQIYVSLNLRTIDWLNANHFDYRGLIEQGLAINATTLNIY